MYECFLQGFHWILGTTLLNLWAIVVILPSRWCPSYIVKNGKIDFSQKGLVRFFSNSGFDMLESSSKKVRKGILLENFFYPRYGSR